MGSLRRYASLGPDDRLEMLKAVPQSVRATNKVKKAIKKNYTKALADTKYGNYVAGQEKSKTRLRANLDALVDINTALGGKGSRVTIRRGFGGLAGMSAPSMDFGGPSTSATESLISEEALMEQARQKLFQAVNAGSAPKGEEAAYINLINSARNFEDLETVANFLGVRL